MMAETQTISRMPSQDRYIAHGVPIEHKGQEFEVHAVHVWGFTFLTLIRYLVRRNLAKRDCLIAVTAFDRGMGKSIFIQLFARMWWDEMRRRGIVPDAPWDWARCTVFYDIEEFHKKYLEDTGHWQLLADDEAFEGMFSRESMKGGTKAQMKGFGTGRFLKKNAIIAGPNLLWFDTLLRNFYLHVWLHIVRVTTEYAEIRIRVRCPVYVEPAKTAYWDCLSHRKYPLDASPDILLPYDATKKAEWKAYQARLADR